VKAIKENEALEEGWVRFTRVYCLDGYIDRWIGDAGSNPNNPKRNQWSLNSFSQWFRFNGGKWMADSELGRGKIVSMIENKNEFTAQQILDKIWQKHQ
jgi:hypothetical protein